MPTYSPSSGKKAAAQSAHLQSKCTEPKININDLVDIQNVVIDTSLPVSEKKKAYHNQIKNPECFRFEDTVVRISYAKSGPSMKDLLRQYLMSGQHTELTPSSF